MPSVTETTIRKREIPANEIEREKKEKQPEFWDYLESLTRSDWEDHLVYIYRIKPEIAAYGGEPAYLEKAVADIEVSPGMLIAMTDRGTVESAIKQKYGGYAFRLIMKKGHERVCEGKCINEMPPRFPQQNGNYGGPAAAQQSTATGSDAVAMRAMETVSGKEAEGIRIATAALQSTAEMMRTLNQPHAAPAADPLRDKIFDVLLTRALAPPPDPVETFIRLKAVLEPTGGAPAGSNAMTDKLLDAAITRFLSPVPTAGRTDIGTELVRALPAIASNVKEAIGEWSEGARAQERTAAIMRGVTPVKQEPGARSQEPGANPPAASAQSPIATQQSQIPSLDPPMEWLELKIVEILAEPSYTVPQAVDESLAFLYRASPTIVGRLLAAGEAGLLSLFQTRPVLMVVPASAKLTEYIKAFITEAKEAEEARKAQAATPKVETMRPN